MKRIIILCDGTWNRADSRTPTNVVRLAQAVSPVGADGVVQVPVYVMGVGTGEGVTRVSRTLDTLLGGAFGWGLLGNVEEAYRHLAFLWHPGDEIHVFGYSRGAYTARSLVGLIRSTGIIGRDALDLIPEAIRRYRTLGDPTTHPAHEESHAFRLRTSLRVVTSAEEAAWRLANGHPAAPVLRIAYLGVWDTVGALGVPRHVPLFGRLTARKYRFHDADLSGMVRAARHALALDERRGTFRPALWRNVAALNAGAVGEPYRQLWFVGDHGAVGGGG